MEKNVFSSCFTGRFGGDPAPKAYHWCSENGRVGAPDWAPLLCTVNMRPGKSDPYLGLFYQTEPLITSDGDYPTSAAEYSYRFGVLSVVFCCYCHRFHIKP